MLFSVIIPTYNRANFLPDTIHSVLQQTFSDFEIIIVDDGSTDDTEKVVQPFISSNSNIVYYKIPNSERGYARNYGANKSNGEWIYFLDSDDILYPDHLEKGYQILFENPNLSIFSLGYDIITSDKRVIESKTFRFSYVNHLLIEGNPLGCHGVFIRKKFFKDFQFNEDRTIAGLEDWELWLRIASHKLIPHFPIITSALVNHSNRSVMQVNKDKWIKKVETFIHYVVNNPSITKTYQKQMPRFYCSAYTYLALHLSFNQLYTKDSFHYLIKGLKHYPLFIFKKRFFAITRNLLRNLLT